MYEISSSKYLYILLTLKYYHWCIL